MFTEAASDNVLRDFGVHRLLVDLIDLNDLLDPARQIAGHPIADLHRRGHSSSSSSSSSAADSSSGSVISGDSASQRSSSRRPGKNSPSSSWASARDLSVRHFSLTRVGQ